MNLPKLTQPQQLVLAAIGSLVISAAGTAITALDQAYTGGNVNVSSLIVTALSVFTTAFGTALYRYVPLHITDELQALKDTVEELRGIVIPHVNTTPPQPPTQNNG